ncbi:hypothetical protein DPMN_081196 [Dreissena polymorpha]|uniref:Paraneoplastic antigen Ma-like C-terminal domain-containing protein n=1 Tax=Dreissena polymorpha TaxID=45954 RepID=A0A9D4B8Z9_DREPO|nr:hypothetical protein DPMN_081196 [Dreissena polymorpha]
MLHMQADATVGEILTELEDNFGNVASSDTFLSRFLSAEQKTGASVTQWGLRLEEMLLQVIRKSKIDEQERRFMLRKTFWRGLKSEELRNATRVHFENNVTYEELRNKVREKEFEVKLLKDNDNRHKIGKGNPLAVETVSCQSNELMQQLMKKIEKLDRKLEDLKKEGQTDRKISNDRAANNTCEYRQRGFQRGGYRRRPNYYQNNRNNYHTANPDKSM